MNGIFGICEAGFPLNVDALQPALDAQGASNRSVCDLSGGQSFAFGADGTGAQIATVDGVTVVVDADLLGLRELARVQLGVSDFASELSPAQILAKLYLRHGSDFLSSLHGAFALALWDQHESRFLLAIDRMGIKSLYWRREGQRILFGSKLRAVRALQSAPVEVNPKAVLQFLVFSMVPASTSIDQGTNKLRPGCEISFHGNRMAEHRYWDFEYPESSNPDAHYWATRLHNELRGAVHRHLEGCDADSTGCYLSGGTDSSTVVAFVTDKLRFTNSFSIAFDESHFSEIDFARTAARTFQTRHHEKFLHPQDAPEAVERIIGYYDEPFANSSAVGSYYCALLASQQGIQTLLAGDGGDELFAGNERYAQDKYFALYHVVPAWLRGAIIEPLARVLPIDSGKLSLPRKYIRRAKIPNPRRILSYGFFLSQPAGEIFSEGFLRAVGEDDWLAIPQQHYSQARASSDLNRILYLDMKMTIADNDLRKVSGTAELAGVNVRYPLLDTDLAVLSGQIPARLKLRGFQKRYIFKQAMKGILPDKILYKKKHGFGVPLAQWLLADSRMNEMMQDVMHDAKTRQRGYFQGAFFDRLLKMHTEDPNFYGEIVWYLLTLELWHRRHVESSSHQMSAVRV